VSNINTYAGRTGHGLDDEPQYVDGLLMNRCNKCYQEAKKVFFAGPPRRGRTLVKVYNEVHAEAHQ
jgi:hypothetical protein